MARRDHKSDHASSVFRSRNTEMAQDRPKMTPRWPIWQQNGPEVAQDAPKMTPRWSQNCFKATKKWCSRVSEMQILLNWLCRRQSALREGPKWPQDGPRTSRDGPEMTQDGPRMPQDGFKMTPRWTQEAKRCAEEAQVVTLKVVAADPR